MAISNQGKRIWGSNQGGSLMRAMLGGQPLTQQDRQTLQELKQGGQSPSQGETGSLETFSAQTEQHPTLLEYPKPEEGLRMPEELPDRLKTGFLGAGFGFLGICLRFALIQDAKLIISV